MMRLHFVSNGNNEGVLSARAIYGEIFRNDEAFRLLRAPVPARAARPVA